MPLYGMPARVLAVAVVAAIVRPCAAWQKWDYLEKNVSTSFEEWTQLWGYSYGPRSRRGHSMVLYGTRAILFAGRDNEVQRNHVPRTYQISNINGSLEFTIKAADESDFFPITCEFSSQSLLLTPNVSCSCCW